MAENGLLGEITGIYNTVEGLLSTPTGAAVGGAVAGAVVGGAVVAGVTALKGKSGSSSSKKRRKTTHTKRGWKQDRKRFNKSQKWEVAYRKRKHKSKSKYSRKSRKGRHYTKNGQPYIILKSGKARFVKK